MVSGYHFLPVAPASWRKTTPAAAVTSVNCRATGGGVGEATVVACGAGLGDPRGFLGSLDARASGAMPAGVLMSVRRTPPRRGPPILPPLPLRGQRVRGR